MPASKICCELPINFHYILHKFIEIGKTFAIKTRRNITIAYKNFVAESFRGMIKEILNEVIINGGYNIMGRVNKDRVSLSPSEENLKIILYVGTYFCCITLTSVYFDVYEITYVKIRCNYYMFTCKSCSAFIL